MRAVREAVIDVRSVAGAACGRLRLSVLPNDRTNFLAPLVDLGLDAGADGAMAQVQVLEGCEYLYSWEGVAAENQYLVAEPQELFQPDTEDGRRGRLRPGLSTGTVLVSLFSAGIMQGQLEIEVRSRKLHYLSEYKWMLRDIADQVTELVMERFAASNLTFKVDGKRDAVTLYQRFSFLRALIESESFQLAIREIVGRPHVAWVERHESVAPGQGIGGGSHVIRQLSCGGARAAWNGGPIDSIPVRMDRRRTEATTDTTPNRFVRFALTRWRQVVSDIDNELALVPKSHVVARGRRELARTLEYLDSLLHQELFKGLGSLSRFPADDQVLQRREGYRDIFRAYLEFELASQLSWKGAEDSYSAGQRDVAALYEYWAFMQLARLVSEIAGQGFDLKPLIQVNEDSLNICLKSGRETVVRGDIERRGRRMVVELCFNRTFRDDATMFSSWSRPMRPDCSLVISASPDEAAGFEPVVVHFDAKYRVDSLRGLFGGEDARGDERSDMRAHGRVKRDDLLKMHAYRDAIRRSAGAYVLYPGGDEEIKASQYSEYQELLPSLGAFVLRPSELGDAAGSKFLKSFLADVIDHVATRLTSHERGRYWLEEVYGANSVFKSRSGGHLEPPAADTQVLLGYVKSAAHWTWIRSRRTYNVRTEGRSGGVAPNSELLYCQLLLLYCPDTSQLALTRVVSGPQIVGCDAMEDVGYPQPKSDYLCVQISWDIDQACTRSLSAGQLDALVQGQGRRKGEPTMVRWGDLGA